MDVTPLPFRAPLAGYSRQAQHLLDGWRSGDPDAVRLFREKHPRFLDGEIRWVPKRLSEAEVRNTAIDVADAQLALARWYDFLDWQRLSEYVEAVTAERSPVFLFESAAEAVIDGDRRALVALLGECPELTWARSSRVTPFDPPVHRATLLHYVAANGVEGYRQRTPSNAVEIARTLLEAGAEVDALADMYGGQVTTLSMLVSSGPPEAAGVQVALVDVLADFGAALEGAGTGPWTSPLMTALVFGFRDAAEALVRRGARVDSLAAAAGLGRVADVAQRLAEGSPEERQRALSLAAQLGHVEIVGLLLDAGEDPSRYNLPGNHAHATPLHQAVWGGHDAVVRLLVERGARLDVEDTIYRSTPLGWAEYGGRTKIASFLRAREARQE